MCGLVALFDPQARGFDAALLRGMERDLYHRGPDGGGTVSGDRWALVFRRLAIIDPQARSDQPMLDPDTGVRLIFNGEIYNFREIAQDLTQRGIPLKTQGDSEVILKGYSAYGLDGLLERLEGMFAFSLVDERKGMAYCVRDPLGIKPLYMLRLPDGRSAFASEMRPLRRLLSETRVDEVALAELLTFGFAAGRLSNLREIERVPPGTKLEIDLSDGTIREARHFDILQTIGTSNPREVSREEVEGALVRSIRAHTLSDVGYAVQLSGGVDSSFVASVLATEGNSPSCYSIRFTEATYDEAPFQEMVAQRYGLKLHQTTMTGKDYCNLLPVAVRHMEGPTPHGGCVALLALCQSMRQSHKVVLTGEGADEFFGGYLRYGIWRRLAMQSAFCDLVPAALIPDLWPFRSTRRLAGVDQAAYASVYHDFRSVSDVFPDLVPSPGAREAASAKFRDFRDRILAVDQTAYLESLLLRQDKISMAASMEARVPFVHLPLARFLNATPLDFRIPGGETKPVLKALARRYLPDELIDRRKIGLWMPYDKWFGRGGDGEGLFDTLAETTGRLRGYADSRRFDNFLATLRSAGRSKGLILQRLIEMETWLRSLPADS